MKLKFGSSPKVSIDLEPGIYVLPADSAVGKSYLCSVLKLMDGYERVSSHSFPAIFHPEDILDSHTHDVVMLDRYDLCDKDYSKEMLKFAEHGILLVDCKSHTFNLPHDGCRLKMLKDELVVT